MPAEKRQVIFANDEVLAAVRQLYLRANQSFPNGAIEDVTIGEEGGCRFACNVVTNNSFRERVTVGEEKLAAALILYCKSRHIPIPTAAQKSLIVVDGELALNITLPASHRVVASNKVAAQRR